MYLIVTNHVIGTENTCGQTEKNWENTGNFKIDLSGYPVIAMGSLKTIISKLRSVIINLPPLLTNKVPFDYEPR